MTFIALFVLTPSIFCNIKKCDCANDVCVGENFWVFYRPIDVRFRRKVYNETGIILGKYLFHLCFVPDIGMYENMALIILD